MTKRELEQRPGQGGDARMAEVEFALVLSRIISSVSSDQDSLRQTVYDLARYKLSEQLQSSGMPASEELKAREALEVAIQGVEAFSRNTELQLPVPPRAAPAPLAISDLRGQTERDTARTVWSDAPSHEFGSVASKRRNGPLAATVRTLAVLVSLVCGLLAVVYRDDLVLMGRRLQLANSAVGTPKRADRVVSVEPAKPTRLLPTDFGVYALSENTLFELDPLPNKAQDARVAISPTMGLTKQPVLQDGHPRFIVYRREAAQNIPERAELRIIAKVAHSINYDAAGKPVETPDDGWYIRNISFPYRVSPIKENAEMYEIQPENGGAGLSPGRYGLVLKGQLYDFVIGGEVKDPRHCLERLTAKNGTFVSQCRQM
ncbi:hypothetical protein [Bradyrhizobium japonicum]|uniref:hypothetical protein n=1 Tax=Bradyrhizobium japonicum TaxID=375 RepID=UPI000676497A|nr:hypothetical protein [Bradyrhizobium japonicum]